MITRTNRSIENSLEYRQQSRHMSFFDKSQSWSYLNFHFNSGISRSFASGLWLSRRSVDPMSGKAG